MSSKPVKVKRKADNDDAGLQAQSLNVWCLANIPPRTKYSLSCLTFHGNGVGTHRVPRTQEENMRPVWNAHSRACAPHAHCSSLRYAFVTGGGRDAVAQGVGIQHGATPPADQWLKPPTTRCRMRAVITKSPLRHGPSH